MSSMYSACVDVVLFCFLALWCVPWREVFAPFVGVLCSFNFDFFDYSEFYCFCYHVIFDFLGSGFVGEGGIFEDGVERRDECC
jgi:hypothetical protein